MSKDSVGNAEDAPVGNRQKRKAVRSSGDFGQRLDEPSEPGRDSEPMPQHEFLETMFDDGGTRLSGHGEIRGDQQAQHGEAQFGAVEKGVKHRGRS